jgi:hypothetical protein
MDGMNDVGVMCCFCGKSIESSHIDPCSMNVLINWDKSQNEQYSQDFYCHIACLKKCLVPMVPLYIEHLGREDDQG